MVGCARNSDKRDVVSLPALVESLPQRRLVWLMVRQAIPQMGVGREQQVSCNDRLIEAPPEEVLRSLATKFRPLGNRPEDRPQRR